MTPQEKTLQGYGIERLGTPNPKCALCGESRHQKLHNYSG